MANFDDILKKGKSAATQENPEEKWKTHIANILVSLQTLNEIYGNFTAHKVFIEQISCNKCGKASYALRLPHLDPEKGIFKYFLHEWFSDNSTTFYCPDCKK